MFVRVFTMYRRNSRQRHRATIRPRVRSAGQDTRLRVAQDHLSASKLRPLPTRDLPDWVAAVSQISNRLCRNPLFQSDLPTCKPVLYTETGHIQNRLRVEALSHGKENLQVSLRLHKAAHHSHRAKEGSICLAGDHGRDDGMVWTFPRCQHIRMTRLKTEILPPVLEREAPAMGDNPRPKARIIAVNERAGIAPFIHNTKVNRIGTSQRGCHAAGRGWPFLDR